MRHLFVLLTVVTMHTRRVCPCAAPAPTIHRPIRRACGNGAGGLLNGAGGLLFRLEHVNPRTGTCWNRNMLDQADLTVLPCDNAMWFSCAEACELM